MERNNIIFNAAGKVHEAWCQGEMDAFYGRLLKAHETIENPGDALREAGNKNGAERNVVAIDAGWMGTHSFLAGGIFTNRTYFDYCVKEGGIDVKRFATRSLTGEEQSKFVTSGDIRTTEDGKIQENILRPFAELSVDSQKENLAAAENAIAVYERLKSAGMSDEEMSKPENQTMIGTIIHTSWMERNPRTESNAYLHVSYDQLGDWEKGQDLDVFSAVAQTAQEQNYIVEQNSNGKLPTSEEIAMAERAAIGDELIQE